MSETKINYMIYILPLFIYISIFSFSKQDEPLYEFPIEIFGQNYLPMIPVYFKNEKSLPKLMLLDINIDKSWIFKPESSSDNNKTQNNKEIIKHDFYTIVGNKNTETIFFNPDTHIDNFQFFDINQIKGENYYPGVLSLNKKMNDYNFIDKLEYDENKIIDKKYFGFCLDFSERKNNEAKLIIGDLYNLNKDISKLARFPLYDENDEIKNSKWAIKLNGLFIGSINENKTENYTIENDKEKKIGYKINRKYNKGLIIDEPAQIETIYNSIYVTKEAMLFLISNYFKNIEKICFRQENQNNFNYEIKYNCLKSKKGELNNINLILENNITLELTSDDLLNCAINQNMNIDSKNNENSETCEFNIKYSQNIEHYVLGLSVFKKYKTYFLFNDNSVLLEGDNFLNCYLQNQKFSNISRSKKKSLMQTVKELFSTTACITFIFALLAGGFYLYERIYGKITYENEEEEATKIINRDKYANL